MQFKFKSKIGLGTWLMGQNSGDQKKEIKAVEHALACGYELIDTAEMYASGMSEKIVGEALQNFGKSKRAGLTLVSKVLPSNASKKGVIKACESSIKRMGCDYLDLYLLHWQGAYPYKETLEGFLELESKGLIKHHGVSNFDCEQMKAWLIAEKALNARTCATNQVYYALNERGIEFELQGYLSQNKITTMAYSPLSTGLLANHKGLTAIAKKIDITPAQLALAWTIRQRDVVAIPKSVNPSRIEENLMATQISLGAQVLLELDALFAPPNRKTTLAVI